MTRSAQNAFPDGGGRSGSRAEASRLRWVATACAALLTLVALPSAAQDVCTLDVGPLRTTVEGAAAQVARIYVSTNQQLSLNDPATALPACNWDCSTDRVITSLVNPFSLLAYSCHRTTSSARYATGSGTTNQMGLSLTDADYRDRADEIFRADGAAVGDLMRVPSEIEEASKSGSVKALTDAVEALSGATWLRFSSTSVDNDNDGADRILLRVVDSQDPPRFEQWIQIAISKGTGRLGRNVDFLARQMESDASSSVAEAQIVAFRGYSRTANGFVPEGGNSASQLSKCYSCHPSGLRPVVPAAAGTRAAGGDIAVAPQGTMLVGDDLASQLADLKDNQTSHLAVFGPAGYEKSHTGPPFGPTDRLGRAEFVAAGCGAKLSEERRDLVVANMDCEMCHNGSNRGVLNAGTSRLTMQHKVVYNDLAPMPPGIEATLNRAERQVLFDCLKAEYAEMLREWMTRDLLMEW